MSVKITDKTFDFTKKYYLAGPMTGYPDFNYAAFGTVQTELQESGIYTRSPHTLEWPTVSTDGEELWQVMMRKAIAMLLECDGIILMRGWIQSKGALVEYNVAASLKMPAYFMDGKYLIPLHDPSRVGW